VKNLASFSMIHQRANRIKENSDLESVGQAFDRLALKIILKLNDDDIEESITDGSNDCGIDAIYLEEQIIHICNCKYTYDIDQTEKNFPGSEIEKIIATLGMIMSSNLSREVVNDAIWDKYLEIRDMFLNGKANKIIIHLVSNKQKPVQLERTKLENAFTRYRIVECKYYDLEDLVNILISGKEQKINSSLLLLDDQHFEKADGALRTIIGVVTAEDYINMLIDSTDNNRLIESAFDDNVRQYRPKHSVNKAIIKSALSDANYQFFYLNNGVTIICEECTYTPHVRNQKIQLLNLQIINGGQTTHSLFEAYKKEKEKVRDIDILVRICIAKKDTALAELISESTNNQIPIGSRDLKANDFIQKKLQDEFEQLGFCYERKNNQYDDNERYEILNNELLAQLYLAFELDAPAEAKNNKGQIFSNLYEIIFNEESISAEYLLDIYKAYLPLAKKKKEIQKRKRRKELDNEKDAFPSRAIFHILNGIKLVLKYESKSLKNESDVIYATERSLAIMKEIVEREMDSRKELYTHDKFFKEITTNKIVAEYFAQKYTRSNCN
jgi:hypothetical protein